MVIAQNEQQKPQLTDWAYLYRNTVQGSKLGLFTAKEQHIWASLGGGLREASWLPQKFSTSPCQTGFSNTLSACTWNQDGSNLFFFKKRKTLRLFLGKDRQWMFPYFSWMIQQVQPGMEMVPCSHPILRGCEVEDALLEGWGGLWCSVSLCQTLWGNERWKDIELWMIFISQFTDERERSVGLAFRECLASEGGRAGGRKKWTEGQPLHHTTQKMPRSTSNLRM